MLGHMSSPSSRNNLLDSPFDGELFCYRVRTELILMVLEAEDLSVGLITQQSLQDPAAEAGCDRVLSLKSRDMDQLSPHTHS